MKIYFGGSISGGRKYLDTYREIVEYLKVLGHKVLTEHVVMPDVLEWESKNTPQQIYTRDIEWLKESECVVAEVSSPSLGVGYEVCYALRIGKPVLCLYREGVFITRMLVGNTSEGIEVKSYASDTDWKKAIDIFLKGI
jgi:2'-deoxynucleoside 5'-phosphate N-hydrolase